jgi:hypothetical protein
MMGHRGKTIDGLEHDAFCTDCRYHFKWYAGIRKKAKKKYNKRQRKTVKSKLRDYR